MRERMTYLDCLRCLAIFLVILLHTLVPVVTNAGVYGVPSWKLCVALDAFTRVGVPLFFMLSGYLMLSREGTRQFAAFYRKNLPKLGIPLVVWNLIYYGGNLLTRGETFRLRDFLAGLLNQGHSYHMWFVYTLLGIYLLCPFLKRMTEGCTGNQLLLLVGIILLPTAVQPMLNLAVYIHLFGPLMEGYLGYFLLGYWLGGQKLTPRARRLLYLLGAAAYLIAFLGNLRQASPQSILLPFNGGYRLHHYFTAAAVFVLVRTFFANHAKAEAALSAPLAWLSNRVFGIYWVHVLVMEEVTQAVGSQMSILMFVGVRLGLTVLISLLFAAVVWKIPVLRRGLV